MTGAFGLKRRRILDSTLPEGPFISDFFVPHVLDLPLLDRRGPMERPCFALFKRKRLKPIAYAGVIKSLLAMPMARTCGAAASATSPSGKTRSRPPPSGIRPTRVPFWPRRRGLASPPSRPSTSPRMALAGKQLGIPADAPMDGARRHGGGAGLRLGAGSKHLSRGDYHKPSASPSANRPKGLFHPFGAGSRAEDQLARSDGTLASLTGLGGKSNGDA